MDETPIKNLLDLETFKDQFGTLTNAFNIIQNAVSQNRDNRKLLVDVQAEQASGRLEPHETYIASRVINLNITREIPPYIAYLTQSRRLALFQPVITTDQVGTTEVLETEFFRVMTYVDWINDYTRAIDGTKLNGFSSIELINDTSKPGHVAVEYVATDALLFDSRVSSIQDSAIVARIYEVTSVSLREYARDFKFKAVETQELLKQLEDPALSYSSTYSEANRIYHTFFKVNGKVFHGWYSKQLLKYLKDPAEFYNGVAVQTTSIPPMDPFNPTAPAEPITQWVPVPETTYPFFVYTNTMTEDCCIVNSVGRADSDFYMQEASCSLWSAFVNTCVLASRTMWSPDNPNPDVGVAPKQLSMNIKQGAIFNQPMKAFHTPWPDAALPKALEMLATQNSTDTNQVNFAVNNRQDTRKTATEIESSRQQQQVMSSVDVTLFSTFLRGVFTGAWKIIQSAALQGKIIFAGGPELIAAEYNVLPAGTIDYIARQEQIASMQSDFPIIGPTAAGPAFLEQYILAKYPSMAQKLIPPLQQAAQANEQKVQALTRLLTAAVTGEDGNLEPEWQAHAQELAALGVKAGGAGPTSAPPSPTNPVPTSGAEPDRPEQPAEPSYA